MPKQTPNRVLVAPGRQPPAAKRPIPAPRAYQGQWDYPATRVGQAGAVTLWAATDLGDAGVQLAQYALSRLCSDYVSLQTIFAAASIPPVDVVVSPLSDTHDGTGGAYHYGCGGVTLYCDADLSQGGGDRTCALAVAEMVEVLSSQQGSGWDCGASNGEGLSRVLAEELYPGVLDDYVTAAEWLDSERANWIDEITATDQDSTANGCAVLFLNWLHSSLGESWTEIVAAAAPTLATTYALLGHGTSAWADFQAACSARWTLGVASGVTVDDPWAGAPTPPPPAPVSKEAAEREDGREPKDPG